MIITYSLDQLPAGDVDFFCDMISYISPMIEQSTRKDTVLEITCADENEAAVRESLKQLYDMITAGKLSGEEIKIKTLADHTDAVSSNSAPIFQEMLDSGCIRKMCSGVYAYSGLFLKIFRYFDRKIAAFGAELFPHAEEYEFPVLYPVKDYEKGKYFETFPHHIMFQTNMKQDLGVLNRFAENGIKDESILEEMKTPENVLRHAACVPVYALVENQTIPDDQPRCFLISGKCFRNEADNVFELARLNEFYMKEYVFIGSPDYCKRSIEASKRIWKFWTETFGLNCKVDTANDSFFASNYKKLKLFQVLGQSKQEFKVQLPASGMYVACGSANHHRTHFSKPYQIHAEHDALCYTACFAFGVERLAYTFLAQKGLDISKWDQATREEIEKYVDLT